jgi:hypothetical protein
MKVPRAAGWCAATFAFFAVVVPSRARADDAACIAASETEATLQKHVKFHEALKQLAVCADPSCPAEVTAECTQRIARINAAMPTVILAAADEKGNDLVAVNVALDGAELTGTLDGRALSIDPGSHVLRFEAPGKAPLEKTLVLLEAEKDRHFNVVLGPPGAALTATTSPGESASVTETPPGSWSTRKTLAIVAGGVGLVGVGVGAAFGLTAISDWSAAKNDCNTTSCSSASRVRGEAEHDSAVTAGNVSTVSFVVGAAGLAGGALLWLLSPSGEHSRPASASSSAFRFEPTMTTRGGGMTMTGSFE